MQRLPRFAVTVACSIVALGALSLASAGRGTSALAQDDRGNVSGVNTETVGGGDRNDNTFRLPGQAAVAQAEPDDPVAQAEPDDPAAQTEPDDPAAQAQPDDPAAQAQPDDPAAQAPQQDPAPQAQPAAPAQQQAQPDPTAQAPAAQTQPAPAAQAQGGPTPLQFNPAEMVAEHNRFRAQHCVPPVTWSDALAASAQAWADQCQCNHNHPRGDFGENIACGHRSLKEAVGSWYSESSDYDFARPGFSSKTGHFTQLVWKGTGQIGCGATAGCPNANGGIWWVCRYGPPGNFEGQFPENVTPACK